MKPAEAHAWFIFVVASTFWFTAGSVFVGTFLLVTGHPNQAFGFYVAAVAAGVVVFNPVTVRRVMA